MAQHPEEYCKVGHHFAFYPICEQWRSEIARKKRSETLEALNSCIKPTFELLKEELKTRCLDSDDQNTFYNISEDTTWILEKMTAYEAFRRCFCKGVQCREHFAQVFRFDSNVRAVAYDKDHGVVDCESVDGALVQRGNQGRCESPRSYPLFAEDIFVRSDSLIKTDLDMKPDSVWQSPPAVARKECAKTVLQECIPRRGASLRANIGKVCISTKVREEKEEKRELHLIKMGNRIEKEAVASCITENIEFLTQAGLEGQVLEIGGRSYRVAPSPRDSLLYDGELPGEEGLTQQQCDLKICQRNCSSWFRESCMSRCEHEYPSPFL